jgi:hypothetical protein
MLTIDQGVGSVLVSALGTTSQVVTPYQTTTYTLTLNGSVSAQVTVTVVPLPSIGISGNINLDGVSPGASGVEHVYSVTNVQGPSTGPLTVSVSQVALNSGLTSNVSVVISSNTCGAGVVPGDSCSFGLTLLPASDASPGAVDALVTVQGANVASSIEVEGTVCGTTQAEIFHDCYLDGSGTTVSSPECTLGYTLATGSYAQSPGGNYYWTCCIVGCPQAAFTETP